MTLLDLLILLPVAFLTSVVSVVTGATSLITVPVMFLLGMSAPEAIASNMVALTALSLGASMQYHKGGEIQPERLKTLTVLTLLGSLLGAVMVGWLPVKALKGVVVGAMLLMAVVVLRPIKTTQVQFRPQVGHPLTFLLGVYGGLFSGGYVTLLTVVFQHTLGFSLREAVASTKWMNVCSSLVAVVVFTLQGQVVWPIALLMAVTMFFGARAGVIWTRGWSEATLRRVFTFAVLLLAARSLVMDVPWKEMF